jgi:hypothetical protein
MDAVRCFVSQSQADWDVYLPQLDSAIRSSINRMRGLILNMMMFGREINMPVDLMFQPPVPEPIPDEIEYVRQLKEAITKAHDVGRQKLKSSQSYMKRDYDVRLHKTAYKPGYLVYILDMAQLKGQNKKLDSPWKGPGIVLEKITAYVYKVKLEKRITVINHDRLKKCCDREPPNWVKKIQKEIRDGVIGTIETGEMDVFCYCRKGDNGSFMIQCDGCDEWYHGECVNVCAEMAEKWTEYFCPTCQQKRPL